jgi:uncharacterized protein YutE (UPF0331/DUF86 family)
LVDPEVVRRRLRQIDRRVAALRAIAQGDRDKFLRDLNVQATAERHLQVAIQAAVDIALHVLADETGETPEDYGSAFVLLARHDRIPAALGEQLRLAVGLRNVLVHAYTEIDPALVWDHLAELGDLTSFASHMESHLVSEDSPQQPS